MTVSVILSALGTTLLIFTISLFVGAILAAFVCAARMSSQPLLSSIAALWIAIIRGVPSLMWLFIIFFGITIAGKGLSGLVAAVAAFSLISSAHLAESYRSGFEAVPAGQYQAIKALALPRAAGLRMILLPQMLPVACSSGLSFSIHLLKDTALASVIGVTEITFFANDLVQRGGNGLSIFLSAGVLYLLLSLPMGLLAHSFSRRFVSLKGTAA